VNFYLCLIKHDDKKTHEEMRVQLHTFTKACD